MATAAAPEHRTPYIDGLRAVAVLLVVAHHVMLHSQALPSPVPFASFAHVMLEGSHGVDLFFVLSGFCLSYPLLQRLRGEHAAHFSVTRYFAKRIVRIVPPYYAAIALLLLTPALHHRVGAADVVKQALFLDWHTSFLNGSFWTLCVEFRWYFFFPIALALWIRRPRAFWTIAGASIVLYAFTRMHTPDAGTLLPFMLGIFAADLEIRGFPRIRTASLGFVISLLLGLLLEQHASMPSPFGAEQPMFFVQTNPGWQLAAFCLVLLAARVTRLRRILSFRPFAAIGTASYSIYLVHEPIVTQVEHSLRLPFVQSMVVAYLAAVAAGFAFWLLFERMWMAGALKARAVASLQPSIARIAQRIDVPTDLLFRQAGVPTRIGSPVPEGETALA